jgi:gas vesicle protein
MDLRKEIADTLSKMTDDIVEKIKPLIPQQKSEGGIDKKDLELMKSDLEKTYISKIHDIEKQRTEETIKTLKEELADIKSKVGKPTIAPEGWSSDAYRAFSEVGTRAMDTLERIMEGRKPVETLFKIIVQPLPQTKEVKSDLASKIEKEGGLVE